MAAGKKTPSFRVRNRRHEAEGTLSKSEILKRIRSGKLTGEEEIAKPGEDRWHKLAAHPDFYDAFLKRLYQKNYHAPGEPEEEPQAPADPSESLSDRATRQGEVHRTRAAKESEKEDGKTHHLGEEGVKGATIHQSLIEELFGKEEQVFEPAAATEALETELEKRGTDLIKIDLPPEEPNLPLEMEKTKRLDFQPGLSPDAPAPTPELPRPPARRWLGITLLIVLLVLLFQLTKGGKNPAAELSEFDLEKPSSQILSTTDSIPDKIKSLLEEGDSLSASDTQLAYAGALTVYRSALSLDESNAVVLGRIAQTAAHLLATTSDPAKLLTEIQRSIERGRGTDPHSAQFYRAEALVALSKNKIEEANQLAANASEADPVNAENFILMADVHWASGNVSGAKLALEDAIKADSNLARSHAFMAKVALEIKDLSRARTEALETLKLNPLHPDAYLALADLAVLQGQAKEAKGLYETCGRLARFTLKEVPSKAFYRLGLLYEDEGISEKAQESFRLAYFYDPSASELKAKVKGLKLDKAALQSLADETEYSREYFSQQGEALLKQKKFGEAIRFFQAAYLTDPKDGTALIRLGEVSEQTANSYEDYRRVMNLYQRALDVDPKLALGHIKLGMLETEQYNLDQGLKHLNQAAVLAPNEASTFVALGKHYYKRQDYAEALNQFLKAAKLNPADSEISYYAGLLRLLFKKDGAREAIRFFYSAYTLDPQNYDALAEWLKLKVANYEKNFAVKFVRSLIDSEPQNASLYWILGEVYAANKEFRRAITYYHQSLDIDNRASKVRMSLAKSLEAIGELDKAVAEFRLASLLDRRNSEGFFKAAELLYQMKKFAEAEEVLKFLAGVTPNYPGTQRMLAKIYEVRGLKDQAMAAMKREVTMNPQNVKYRLELAELYMGYEKFDLAVTELTEVTNLPSLSKAPEFLYDKIRGYLLLSRCYRAQNKPESAEGTIKLALEIDNSDPELHRELGYVYYAMQRDKEGVREFEAYLNRNPAARDAATIKGLIQQMMIEE